MNDLENNIDNNLEMEELTIFNQNHKDIREDINISQDIDTIYNFLLDELFNTLEQNEEIILPDKDDKITRPDLSFNIHKRTIWKNFKENLKQICKEDMFLTIRNYINVFIKEDTEKLFELVNLSDKPDKSEYKKVNDLLNKKFIQITNLKINKIFGKKENELVEQNEFNKLTYSDVTINNLIDIIYKKTFDYILDSEESTPINKLVNEILTIKEVDMLKFFENEYKKPPSINKENHFLIHGRYVNMIPNTIKKYINTYIRCDVCKSNKTIIIKNFNMSIDYKSCSKCKSKRPIIKGMN